MTTDTLLGKVAHGPIRADQIERWTVKPNVGGVQYVTEELLCQCPVTHQPDTYHATITWDASQVGYTLESKGVKHYLWRYRDLALSCEDLAATIARDLTNRLGTDVEVVLTQQVRGGLELTASAEGAGW